jgi:uncharacterized membrane-anchored protein YhcB (DUF1043 family)
MEVLQIIVLSIGVAMGIAAISTTESDAEQKQRTEENFKDNWEKLKNDKYVRVY